MRTKRSGVVAGVGLLLVLAAVPVLAHHSFRRNLTPTSRSDWRERSRNYEKFPAAWNGDRRRCYQAKDGSLKANGRDLTFPDGRKLFLGSSGTGAPRDGRDPTEPKR